MATLDFITFMKDTHQTVELMQNIFAKLNKIGSVAQFVGDFDLIMGLVKVFDEVCGKSLVFDRRGARAKARRLAPRLV